MTFTQIDLDMDVYMELPEFYEVRVGTKKEYVLHLKKLLYGLKQASTN